MRRKNYWAWVAIFFLAIIRPASGAAVTLRPYRLRGQTASLAIVADDFPLGLGFKYLCPTGHGFHWYSKSPHQGGQ